MARLFCWLALLAIASAPAHAADLPGPWVEFTAGGGLDVRAVTMPDAARLRDASS